MFSSIRNGFTENLAISLSILFTIVIILILLLAGSIVLFYKLNYSDYDDDIREGRGVENPFDIAARFQPHARRGELNTTVITMNMNKVANLEEASHPRRISQNSKGLTSSVSKDSLPPLTESKRPRFESVENPKEVQSMKLIGEDQLDHQLKRQFKNIVRIVLLTLRRDSSRGQLSSFTMTMKRMTPV